MKNRCPHSSGEEGRTGGSSRRERGIYAAIKVDSEAARHRVVGRKEQKDIPETKKLKTEGDRRDVDKRLEAIAVGSLKAHYLSHPVRPETLL